MIKEAELSISSRNYSLQRFQRAVYERGPHPIPRKRQVANEFHRIHSIKAGNREVCVESPLEADAVIWAEGTPSITRICEQSLRIYEPLGKKPFYTFDFEFNYKDLRAVHYEVKPESSLIETEDGRKLPSHWQEIEAWCDYTGHSCDVLTDLDFKPYRQMIANWRRLLPFVRPAIEAPEPDIEADLLRLVRDMQPVTIAEIMMQMPTVRQTTVMPSLANLLHTGQVNANLNEKRLSPMTVLRETSNDD